MLAQHGSIIYEIKPDRSLTQVKLHSDMSKYVEKKKLESE